jgi:hypothetical protein
MAWSYLVGPLCAGPSSQTEAAPAAYHTLRELGPFDSNGVDDMRPLPIAPNGSSSSIDCRLSAHSRRANESSLGPTPKEFAMTFARINWRATPLLADATLLLLGRSEPSSHCPKQKHPVSAMPAWKLTWITARARNLTPRFSDAVNAIFSSLKL